MKSIIQQRIDGDVSLVSGANTRNARRTNASSPTSPQEQQQDDDDDQQPSTSYARPKESRVSKTIRQ